MFILQHSMLNLPLWKWHVHISKILSFYSYIYVHFLRHVNSFRHWSHMPYHNTDCVFPNCGMQTIWAREYAPFDKSVSADCVLNTYLKGVCVGFLLPQWGAPELAPCSNEVLKTSHGAAMGTKAWASPLFPCRDCRKKPRLPLPSVFNPHL